METIPFADEPNLRFIWTQPQWCTIRCQLTRRPDNEGDACLVARNGHVDQASLDRYGLLFIGYALPPSRLQVATWLRKLGYSATAVDMKVGIIHVPNYPGHYYEFDQEQHFLTHVTGLPMGLHNDQPVLDHQVEVDRTKVARLVSLIQRTV